MPRARIKLIALLSFGCLALAGCKFVPTAEKQKSASQNTAQGQDRGFDAKVAEMWETKVLPYAAAKAGGFAEVQAALAGDAETAGAKYGYREKAGSSPWTVLAKIEAPVIAANTESRAAYLDADSDADGKPDLRIQIGPVFRGTAIRDSLDFVNFNEFTNQIDFAQFGKAFNTHVDKTVTSGLDRSGVVGKTVKALVAYPVARPGEVPLAVPLTIELVPP
jgi:predicted lipoprotein